MLCTQWENLENATIISSLGQLLVIKEQITLFQVLFHYLLRLYLKRFINMRSIVTYNNVLSVQLYKCWNCIWLWICAPRYFKRIFHNLIAVHCKIGGRVLTKSFQLGEYNYKTWTDLQLPAQNRDLVIWHYSGGF